MNRLRMLSTVGLIAGSLTIWASPSFADEDGSGEEQPNGMSSVRLDAELNASLDPPRDFLDGELELNPVSGESLALLSRSNTVNSPIFRKYAFVPDLVPNPFLWPGIDHLAAGTGTRNTGFGTIRFRGTPTGATPVSAFLYWATIISTPPTPTQIVTFNGNPVMGFLIGTSPSPCWAGTTLVAYRAPVLPFLIPGVNGDYSVTGLPSGLTTGQDPWNPISSVLPLSEGASLIVLYMHSSVPAGTWTQIHHPITSVTSVFGTFNFTHFLNLPITVAAMKHTRIGADGQAGFGLAHSANTSSEQSFLAGPIPAPFVQIRGCGAYPSGSQDSDWNGTDGEPLNQLWDTHTMNIPGIISPGFFTTNYRVRYVANFDCIVPVAHVITAR